MIFATKLIPLWKPPLPCPFSLPLHPPSILSDYNKGICRLFSHQNIVFRSIQHFLRINCILNDMKVGIVYS